MSEATNQEQATPETTPAPRLQCRHIHTDGRRCASPTLRGPAGPENFCYYHHTTRVPIRETRTHRADLDSRQARLASFDLPLPEDRSAIQHAIGQILIRIAANQLDPRRAGLLLYGLQIASLNLPKIAAPTPASSIPPPVARLHAELDKRQLLQLGAPFPSSSSCGDAARRSRSVPVA